MLWLVFFIYFFLTNENAELYHFHGLRSRWCSFSRFLGDPNYSFYEIRRKKVNFSKNTNVFHKKKTNEYC